MTNRKIGILDLGTNTFHLIIALVKENTFEILYKQKIPVMIGRDGISKGTISGDAQERAILALEEFKRILHEENVEEIHATATSAFRNADNGQAFIKKIRESTQLDILVIPGDQEAEYIYYGVKHALDIGGENALILDIGGGSVEFIICNNNAIRWKASYEIGGQRLLDLFHVNDPITRDDIKALESYLGNKLKSLEKAIQYYQPKTLIGASGAFDTLNAINLIKHDLSSDTQKVEFFMSIENYYNIHDEIITKNRAERLKIPGMIQMRVDMIVVACCLIDFIVKKYNLQQIRVSAYALKEGVLNSIIKTKYILPF